MPGRGSNYHRRLDQRRWRAVRLLVFKRDSYRCQGCGVTGVRFECDHVISMWTNPDQNPYDLDGLQTLCKDCHHEKSRSEIRGQGVWPDPERRAWRALIAKTLP